MLNCPPPSALYPNLFLIGAPKCGTTALYHALSHLPQVTMSRVKETGFFANPALYPLGPDHYLRSYFPAPPTTPYRGEASPWYLYSDQAPGRIHQAVGSGPIMVALLRNPTDRAISMYFDQVGAGLEGRPIEEALSPTARPMRRYEQNYLDQGRYSHHLERWLRQFGDHVHVLPAPSADTIGDIRRGFEAALGITIDTDFITDLGPEELNVAGHMRLGRAINGLRLITRSRSVKVAVRRVLPPGFDQRLLARIRHRAYHHYRDPAETLSVPGSVIRVLDDYYSDEVDHIQARWQIDLGANRSYAAR